MVINNNATPAATRYAFERLSSLSPTITPKASGAQRAAILMSMSVRPRLLPVDSSSEPISFSENISILRYRSGLRIIKTTNATIAVAGEAVKPSTIRVSISKKAKASVNFTFPIFRKMREMKRNAKTAIQELMVYKAPIASGETNRSIKVELL